MTTVTAPGQRRRVTGLAVVTFRLGLLALAPPLGAAEYPAARSGAPGHRRGDRGPAFARAIHGCGAARGTQRALSSSMRMTMAIRLREVRCSVPAALSRGLQTGSGCRRHRRDRSGLGHELGLRHGEPGGWHVELLGGVADRHLARRYGPRGAGAGRRQRRAGELCPRSARNRIRRFLVRRHRRHG